MVCEQGRWAPGVETWAGLTENPWRLTSSPANGPVHTSRSPTSRAAAPTAPSASAIR